MFLENKWLSHYHALIEKAKSRSKPNEYCESHHAIPASLGGSKAKSNLVFLTAREHLVAHKLLVRCTTDEAKRKMQMALWSMLRMRSYSTKDRAVPSSRDFAQSRKLIVAAKTGVPRTEETKRKLSESLKKFNAENGSPNKGRSYAHLSDQDRIKLFGSKNRGRVQTQEEKDRRAQSNKGKKRSPEIREKMRLAALAREAKKRQI